MFTSKERQRLGKIDRGYDVYWVGGAFSVSSVASFALMSAMNNCTDVSMCRLDVTLDLVKCLPLISRRIIGTARVCLFYRGQSKGTTFRHTE